MGPTPGASGRSSPAQGHKSSADDLIGRSLSQQGRLALLIAGVAGVAFVGCGGSGNTASSGSTAGPDGASASPGAAKIDRGRYIDRAEAICRRSVREARAVGDALSQAVAGAASPQVGITTNLIRPAVEILDRESARLRSLGPAPPSQTLAVYLGLFDPIVELARQRLRAGLANEVEWAHRLELLIAGLADEQSQAAEQYGLGACSVKFAQAAGVSG